MSISDTLDIILIVIITLFTGARLAFESEEKAKHAGVYFKELWADFCFREAEKK